MRRRGAELARTLSNLYLRVVGCGRVGTGTTIVLDLEKSRFLFNCEENIEMVLNESNITDRVDQLTAVFVTHPKWQRYVSVPNYGHSNEAMEIRSVKPNHFKVYTAKAGVVRRVLRTFKKGSEAWEVLEAEGKEGVYRDENIRVCPVVIRREGSDNLNTVVAYHGVVRDNAGEIIWDKVRQFGLEKKFKLIDELIDGKSVLSENGDVIYKHDIFTPPSPGPTFLILECPSEAFIQPIISNTRLQSLQKPADQVLKVVIHLAPHNILTSPLYMGWIKRFDSSTEHILVPTDHRGNVPLYGYKMRCVLNLVSPTFYPIIKHSLVLPRLPMRCENVYIAEGSCSYNLVPRKKRPISFEVARLPTQTEVMRECYQHIQECFDFHKTRIFRREISPGVFVNTHNNNNNNCLEEITPMQHYNNFLNNNNNKQDLTPTEGDPLILFLGTASAGSTGYRNASCVLLRDWRGRGYLLDCGPGSYMQLWDRFGERTGDILASLRLVFLSHRHIDHHSGVTAVLRERASVARDRLVVCGPRIVGEKLELYSREVEDLQMEFIELSRLQEGVSEELAEQLCVRDLRTVRVKHCYDAYGVCLTHREGWKVVYSGDTLPVEELVRAGQGADLLIHEATFGRGFEDHARLKRHSTAPQAIEVGRRMLARFTVLTHFSKRYNKLPMFEEQFVTGSVVVAFDMMGLLLSHLPLMAQTQDTIRHFVPKYMREASRMAVGNQQWDSLNSWEKAEL